MATDTYAQVNRLLTLDSPAGEKLLPVSFTAAERVSGLFNTQLEIVAERADAASIVPEEIVGKKMTLQMAITSEYEGSPRRYINGMVSRFSQGHSDRRFVHYRAEVVPWLWLMTLASGCRIFQEMTVLDIIQKVFDEFKGHYPELVAYRVATTKDYTKFDYCVQYRETAFNFVSRLMEEEGILYFFEHEKDKHTLVLADNPAAHKPCPNQPTGQYVPEGGVAEADNPVLDWQVVHELRSGKYTLRDFHFQMPSKSLEVVEPTKFEIAGNSKLEIYDYPGEYAQRFNNKDRQGEVEPEATKLVKVRMEEQETLHAEIQGDSLCRGFLPGYAFKLAGHSNRKMNGDYVLTEVRHAGVQTPSYVAEGAGETAGEPYRNTFTCIPAEMLFTPPRTTPQPVVQGPQTAMVVGPAGEEIYTDEFSRVKVQFHWDREGKRDENSSCWVRVSQPWAGQGWGSVSVPRIGQEVVVDFVEGDPNHPLIVGRLYNAESMPPYALPGSGVVSGLKSNSTPGGGGYNEMSMNDTKGKEMITIHAQYDMSTTILHDETISVKNNRTEDVHDGNETVTIHTGNRTVSVNTGNEELNVLTGKRTVNVNTGDETLNVLTGKRTVNVAAGTDSLNVLAADQNVTVNAGNANLTVAAADRKVAVPAGTYHVSAKNVQIDGTQEILLAVGGNSIKIDMSGITLFGTLIKIN